MKIVTTVAFLHLWSYATAGVSGSTETVVTASPGDIALLPCYTAGNVTPSLTTWMKNGGEVIISGGPSTPTPTPTPTPPAIQRLIVLHDGSLNIQGVRAGDEGSYLCNSSMQGNITYHGRVLLQVVSGPENVSLSVGAATALPNGTLYTILGSTVNFNCSGSSYPSQQLTLAFRGASSSNDSLVSTSGSWLDYKITDIQPSAQGVYSCLAQNPVSGQRVNKSTELLVYYASDRHPQCMWVTAQDPYHIVFNCSWFGVYPTPTLRWDEGEGVQGGQWKGHIYATETADSLSVTLNRSQMFDGQMVRCMAQHPAIHAGDVKKCDFTLRRPFPEGDPLVTALEASSVTLTCTDERSVPSSNTTWRKGLQQDEIVPGSKYLLSQEGYTWKLTILNVSKDDEGPYFCRSENPLDVRELEVYLTVKTSSAYTGAIIGVFIAAVIVGSAIIIAKTVYSSRHRICLGGGFGQVEDDRGDVLSLVESDDEQMFQDAVPRLPPLTNGQHTTLVQIHRIPSSDHEDAETTDTSSQQQQQQHEETKLTEEPVESLVTF